MQSDSIGHMSFAQLHTHFYQWIHNRFLKVSVQYQLPDILESIRHESCARVLADVVF